MNTINIKKAGIFIPLISVRLDRKEATHHFTLVLITYKGDESTENTFPIPPLKDPYAAYNFTAAIMEFVMDKLGDQFQSNSQVIHLMQTINTYIGRAVTIVEHVHKVMGDEVVKHNKEIKKPNPSGLKVGDKVKVFCMAPLPGNVSPRPSKSLGEIVSHDNPAGIAVLYQGDELRIGAFRLEVVESE